MDVRTAALRQYQEVVDQAARAARSLEVPPEGWLATARKALGMPGVQLARRMGVSRARISQAEQSERAGGATLKTMAAAADAMGCRFVYAIIPAEGSAESIVSRQALTKARAIVRQASAHMALEKQSLSAAQDDAEIARIAGDLLRAMPRDLWAD